MPLPRVPILESHEACTGETVTPSPDSASTVPLHTMVIRFVVNTTVNLRAADSTDALAKAEAMSLNRAIRLDPDHSFTSEVIACYPAIPNARKGG